LFRLGWLCLADDPAGITGKKPSMRHLACLFLAIALCGSSAYADTPLRIMTFNAEILVAPGERGGDIERFRWDVARREQFEQIAAVIEGLNPDVLNLLEVTSKQGVDLLVEILHEKGLTDYRGYHLENRDTFSKLDVALISRIAPEPIDGQQIRLFYSEEGDPTWREIFEAPSRDGGTYMASGSLSRHAVYMLNVGGYKLGFLGLHLKSNPSDEYSNAQRTAQAKIAQRILKAEIAGKGYLPVVLGDINDFDPDVPDQDDNQDTVTEVIATLKDFDPAKEGPELVNVASLMPRKEDRFSCFWDRNENGAKDPYDVFSMIDHIFLPKELMPHVKRAFIFHAVPLTATDHYPVVVDLVLPER
jgi:endonuclease/exonuclease/phosphatase family metal-dependent hydrolase